MAVVFPSDTSLAVRIAVLAAHSERRAYTILAHRGSFATDELGIDATPHGFRHRDPRALGMSGQLSVLVFGQVDLGTYHGVIPCGLPRCRVQDRSEIQSVAADTSPIRSLPTPESYQAGAGTSPVRSAGGMCAVGIFARHTSRGRP